MKAQLDWHNETVEGKTINDIRVQLCGMLKIEGPQALTAKTETGVTIHVELFEGNDYILPAAAALGALRSDRKTAAARQNGRKGGRPALRTRAANRIDKMGFTEQQEDFIWADWPNIDEHYHWLLTASKDEIIDWIDAGQ